MGSDRWVIFFLLLYGGGLETATSGSASREALPAGEEYRLVPFLIQTGMDRILAAVHPSILDRLGMQKDRTG